jgi:hypothetical protein
LAQRAMRFLLLLRKLPFTKAQGKKHAPLGALAGAVAGCAFSCGAAIYALLRQCVAQAAAGGAGSVSGVIAFLALAAVEHAGEQAHQLSRQRIKTEARGFILAAGAVATGAASGA